MRYCFLIILTVFLAVQTVPADQVYLTNGDKISGKVIKLVDGKLTLKSELIGELTLKACDIKTLNSDEPVEVHLKDGTTFNCKLIKAEDGHFAIGGDNVLLAQNYEIAKVASFNPPEKSAAKLTGNAVAGFTSTHGNTKNESMNFSADMQKRTEKDRTTISAMYIRSEQENPKTKEISKTEDNWRLKGKYDYFLSKKCYVYLDGRYEKDSIAQLDKRMIIGVGNGYQWIETDAKNLSTEIGIASLYEKFDNQTDSNSELSIQAGYHFDAMLNEKIKFINDMTYYPTLSSLSDYLISTTAELRLSATDNMYTSFKTIFDYDTTPAKDSGSTDLKYIFGVGIGF